MTQTARDKPDAASAARRRWLRYAVGAAILAAGLYALAAGLPTSPKG